MNCMECGGRDGAVKNIQIRTFRNYRTQLHRACLHKFIQRIRLEKCCYCDQTTTTKNPIILYHLRKCNQEIIIHTNGNCIPRYIEQIKKKSYCCICKKPWSDLYSVKIGYNAQPIAIIRACFFSHAQAYTRKLYPNASTVEIEKLPWKL